MAGNSNSGNYQSTGKSAMKGPELVQRIRGAVLRTFDLYEDQRGKTIPELLLPALEDNPLKFLEVAAKYCPKDMTIETKSTKDVKDLTIEELMGMLDQDKLAEIVGRKARERLEDKTIEGEVVPELADPHKEAVK